MRLLIDAIRQRRRLRRETTFHRCLAVHLFYAAPRSALHPEY